MCVYYTYCKYWAIQCSEFVSTHDKALHTESHLRLTRWLISGWKCPSDSASWPSSCFSAGWVSGGRAIGGRLSGGWVSDGWVSGGWASGGWWRGFWFIEPVGESGCICSIIPYHHLHENNHCVIIISFTNVPKINVSCTSPILLYIPGYAHLCWVALDFQAFLN